MNRIGTADTHAARYESFYGLSRPPFTLSPDPQFLYLSESHDTAIRQILAAVRRKETFIVLSGEIGTGKTTICRAVVEQLDRTVFVSLVLNPFLTFEELLRQLLADFGVISPQRVPGERLAAASKHDLSRTLHEFLRSLGSVGGSAVLIVDEAQHLSPQVLEELRVLASASAGEVTPLQIALVGQPGLLELLAAADLRQLDQRISLRALVTPLTREDVQEYITHRLTVAGESVSVLFEPAAVARIHAISGGVPRVINLLCDRALAAGAERGVHEIDRALVDRAADALTFRRHSPAPERASGRLVRYGIAALAIAGALVTIALATPLHRLIDATTPALPESPVLIQPIPTPVYSEDLLKASMSLPPAGETPDNFVPPKPSQ